MYTVCVVEDERNLNNLLKTYLEKEGYNVIQCFNGKSAMNINEKIHIWILDIMLNDEISGYDIIKKIREKDSVVPVIFTSARDQEIDKILGLEMGSDDYVTKPYSPKELMLRISNMIKRVYRADLNKIKYEKYNIDKEKRSVFCEEEEIRLTALEFDLLILFIDNIGKSFTRDEILNSVWGTDYFGSDRVVDDLVRRLRAKMPDLNINTIYGLGYRLS
ncbi:MAG: response regulator transcription factor [Clostridia bacterium]|nr:response regulator transcription factor [Clostridia bacterium]